MTGYFIERTKRRECADYLTRSVWTSIPNKRLKQTHTHTRARTHLANTKRKSQSKMQIFIKTLTGRRQAFNFEPENQVLAVKQALQEKEGIQVEQIRLIFSGKQLWVFWAWTKCRELASPSSFKVSLAKLLLQYSTTWEISYLPRF